ncbi:MAG: hypothetical protein WCO40_09735 [Thermoleophilia bacterium]
MSRMSLRALVATFLLIAIALLAACGGEDGTKFDQQGAPFTFSYPKDLQKVFANTGREIQGLNPEYRVALGTDETNVVVVATYKLAKDVSKVSKTNLSIAVERSARALARAMNAEIPKKSSTDLGELPATQFEFVTKDRSLTTRLVYAFQGKTQYFVRCQWNESGKDSIPPACDQVTKTFAPN